MAIQVTTVFAAAISAWSLCGSVARSPSDSRGRLNSYVGDPTYEFRIIPKRHLQIHGWRRQACLLENLVKSEAHLGVRTGTPEGLMDQRSARGPEREALGKQKKGCPRQLMESDHSTGTN